MMTWYLVDLENIGYAIVDFIRAEKPSTSKFFLYYTSNMNLTRVDFWEDMMNFNQDGYRLEFIRCPGGQQAADKIILADLGVNAQKNKKRNYVVVSKDKGYAPGIDRVRKATSAWIVSRTAPTDNPARKE